MHYSTDVLQGVPGRIPQGKINKNLPYNDPVFKTRPDAFVNFKAELYNGSLPTDISSPYDPVRFKQPHDRIREATINKDGY